MDMQDMLDSLGWQDKPLESTCQQTVPEIVKCEENAANETEHQRPTTSGVKVNVASVNKSGNRQEDVVLVKPMDVEQEGTSIKSERVSVKKRLGRPPRSSFKDLKPTRGSERKKSSINLLQIGAKQSRCLWSSEDKKTLLQALEEVGPDNIKGIQAYLPHKLQNNIRNQIRMWKDFARIDLQKKMVSDKKKRHNTAIANCVSKLDEWIEHFEELAAVSPAKQFALANVFLLISEYAEFPPPDECSGVDFRAMYRYIHCLLNGKPFYGVNAPTAQLLNENISHMFSMIREYNRVGQLANHLYEVEPQERKPPIKNFGRAGNRVKKTTSLCMNPEAILHISQMNPLNMPPQAFVKPSAVEEDTDSDWVDEEDGA